MADKIFCGIEGGASRSKIVLMTGDGKILNSLEGPAINYLLIGIDNCQSRIIDLIKTAKESAKLKNETILDSVGLCMSGCEDEEGNKMFKKKFMEKYSVETKNCIITSDTVGPLYTASPKGGLVLIAGTGSNSLLINPDGSTGRCGGWGHVLGDEASAMWISLKAVKAVFDHEDNLHPCPHDISKVKELMLQHFKIDDKMGILPHCYTNFCKTSFAGLCEKLSKGALEHDDPLCKHVFFEAGRALGSMVAALKPKVHRALLDMEGGLPIICVGSVFKSWSLLEKGFVSVVEKHYEECTLRTLTCSCAIGAAYLAGKDVGVEVPLDPASCSSVLFHFKRS